ncbi:uncharacterized protein LOC117321549 isoform X1 [Pecten maximus]|uniref:uncharacterized protein LOC117321547 isoform X1 n=2 Tax=Pecten maximus TaxID=6579 RepID=UPI0014581E31|nr:uncharacterized protein LOC117321547 isoform X1 [Pecten maximus]XP_033731886.1 uncharacterized protein LOC117321549 isoform X1 [Pecten maximus]
MPLACSVGRDWLCYEVEDNVMKYKRCRLTIEAMTDVMIVKSLTSSVEQFDPEDAINRFLMKTPSGGMRRPEFERSALKAASTSKEIEGEAVIEGDGQAEAEIDHQMESDSEDVDSDVEGDFEPGFDNMGDTFTKVLKEAAAVELEHETVKEVKFKKELINNRK